MVIIAIAYSSLAVAQSTGITGTSGIRIGTEPLGTRILLGSGTASSMTNSRTKPEHSLFSPQDAAPFQLSNYDSTLAPTDVVAGQLIVPYLLISLGERFTLPAASGFVDSVVLQLDTVTPGNITVALFPDTLIDINGAGAYYHLMNNAGMQYLSDFNQLGYATQTISSDSVRRGVPTTVYFPHVAVPQSFFVAVTPEISGSQQVSDALLWRGDQEAVRARTPDNTRSAYIAEDLRNQGIFAAIMDSTFVVQGNYLFTNFYATLYGSAGSAGVPIQLSSAHDVALYPNPATTVLNIPSSLQTSDFELRDILGRTVLHTSERNIQSVDVHMLASGSYLAFMHTAGGIITTSVMISR
jgi:hypothetical protein